MFEDNTVVWVVLGVGLVAGLAWLLTRKSPSETESDIPSSADSVNLDASRTSFEPDITPLVAQGTNRTSSRRKGNPSQKGIRLNQLRKRPNRGDRDWFDDLYDLEFHPYDALYLAAWIEDQGNSAAIGHTFDAESQFYASGNAVSIVEVTEHEGNLVFSMYDENDRLIGTAYQSQDGVLSFNNQDYYVNFDEMTAGIADGETLIYWSESEGISEGQPEWMLSEADMDYTADDFAEVDDKEVVAAVESTETVEVEELGGDRNEPEIDITDGGAVEELGGESQDVGTTEPDTAY